MLAYQAYRHLRKDFRVSCEARPASFEGPQRACHIDELEFCVFESGIEKVQFDHGPITTRAKGTYDLLPPGTVHSSWADTTPVVETIVHFRVDWLRSLHEAHGLPAMTRWRTGAFAATQEILHVSHMLRRALVHPDDGATDLMVSSLVTFLAAHLVRRHHKPNSRDLGGVVHRLRRSEDWMRECPNERFTIEMLAACAGMSPFHYLRSFKKEYGVSPYAFLLRQRVQRATELVRGTDMPLTQIAFDTGFGSSSRLTAAIRKTHGITPTELRRSSLRDAS
jgi:AraC-like DNA-binding protein